MIDARAVEVGLEGPRRSLPAWLFYDDEGTRLFEAITRLPEYYLARAEREIFEVRGEVIVAMAHAFGRGPLEVIELGAGTARKSQILLAALVARQGATRMVPVDVSASALEEARDRLARELPRVTTESRIGTFAEALAEYADAPGRRLVLFIGSSVGNLDAVEANVLLAGVRDALGDGGALLLGTDLRKDPATMLRAYDDAAGVTAAFNRNLLVRINRELGGTFRPERFRHVVVWNPGASRVEMHLESACDQDVHVAALGLRLGFAAGERIHTESCAKYDLDGVDVLLAGAGLRRVRSWRDDEGRFAVHLVR